MISHVLKVVAICTLITTPLQTSPITPFSKMLVLHYLTAEKEAANPTLSQAITKDRQSRNYQPEFYTYLESTVRQLNRGFHHCRPHAITDVNTIFIYPGNTTEHKPAAKSFEERWPLLQKKWQELSGPVLPDQNTIRLRGHWEYEQDKTTQEVTIKNLHIKTIVCCQQHELNSLLTQAENPNQQQPILYKHLVAHYFATHHDKPKEVDAFTTAQAEQFCQEAHNASLTSPFYVLTFTTVIPLAQLEELSSQVTAAVTAQHTNYHLQRRAQIKEKLDAMNAKLAQQA